MDNVIKKKNVINFLLIGILLLVLPFAVTLVQRQQFFKTRAAGDKIKFVTGSGVSCDAGGECSTKTTTVRLELRSPLGPPDSGVAVPTTAPSPVPTSSLSPVSSPNPTASPVPTEIPTTVPTVTSLPTLTPTPTPVSPFNPLSAQLTQTSAVFQFSFPRIAGIYQIRLDVALTSNMQGSSLKQSLGVATAGGTTIIIADPSSKWPYYGCDKTIFWRVTGWDSRGPRVSSPIQSTSFPCAPAS